MTDNAFTIKNATNNTLIFYRNVGDIFWSRRPFPHALRRLHLKNLKCLCNLLIKFTAKFHKHVVLQALSLSLIRQTACVCVQFSRCSWTTNAHSETGQMAVCCQNVTLGAFTSLRTLSVPVGVLFKKFGLFLNRLHISKACLLWGENYFLQVWSFLLGTMPVDEFTISFLTKFHLPWPCWNINYLLT